MKYSGWFSGMLLATLVPLPMVAQGVYPLALAPTGTRFSEIITTQVTSQTAGGELRRDLFRSASYLLRMAGDTIVASADSMTLSERGSDVRRELDTDGFVGGRYKFFLTPSGVPKVVVRPFVPEYLMQVSDLEQAMESFLPQRPPTIAVGASGAGPGRRQWDRLADSAGVRRYHYRDHTTVDTTQTVADSVNMSLQQSVDEEGWLVWDLSRGPLAWRRSVVSNSTTKLRGQVVRTKVEQQIRGSRKDG